MAKIKSRRISWPASPDTNVVNYELYCAYGDTVTPEAATILLPGNQLTYELPGIFSMNLDGNYTLMLCCYDSAGNQSDFNEATTSFFDFTPPAAPGKAVIN